MLNEFVRLYIETNLPSFQSYVNLKIKSYKYVRQSFSSLY